jgi:hypothetical protein
MMLLTDIWDGRFGGYGKASSWCRRPRVFGKLAGFDWNSNFWPKNLVDIVEKSACNEWVLKYIHRLVVGFSWVLFWNRCHDWHPTDQDDGSWPDWQSFHEQSSISISCTDHKPSLNHRVIPLNISWADIAGYRWRRLLHCIGGKRGAMYVHLECHGISDRVFETSQVFKTMDFHTPAWSWLLQLLNIN